MIKSIQKIITIGSSEGVTLPAKELKRHNIRPGDEVKVTVEAVKKPNEDQAVIDAAKKILKDYKQDFHNLARR